MSIDVGIVLPVRNGAATIDRQLAALPAGRTMRRWELSVSDNGSTDETGSIVEAWRDRLPRLTVVDSSSRRGVSQARNGGVQASKGSYVSHCDDDDAVSPGWIEELATGRDGADIVGGRLDNVSLDPSRFRGSLSEDSWSWREQQGGIWFSSGSNLGYRREVFDRAGGFDALEFACAAFRLGAAYASHCQMPPSPGPVRASGTGQDAARPLVTVGVTAFDAVDTVERAVLSAVAQTWEPLEVVIVDDASTDGTPETLERLAEEYPTVRVIRHAHNLGVASARNTVLAAANGEFVAFFDDDDVSHPDRVARQVARLYQHEQRFGTAHPVLCHTARTVVGPDGADAYIGAVGTDPLRPAPSGAELVGHLLQGRPLPGEPAGGGATCTQLGRRSTYQELGGFDPTFRRADDTELNVRLGAAGGGHIGVAEPLVDQYVTTGPDKGVAADGAAMIELLAKHRGLLPDLETYAATRRWVQGRTAWRLGRRRAWLRHLAVAWAVQPVAIPRRLTWVVRRFLQTRWMRRRSAGR